MSEFFIFFLVGALAQLVDGALGMAYGVISSTVLLAFGIPPAQASASVHAAELFTTAASGTGHILNRNIDWRLFWRLVPFGVAGGALGAYVLAGIEADAIKPYIAAYLGIIGIVLFVRSFHTIPRRRVPAIVVPPVAAAGGFLDAIGGGGWGPIVTSGLLGAGGQPRYVIGTVNTSEFLIALTVSLSFAFALLTGHWEDAPDLMQNAVAVGGLILGGLVVAPVAGYAVRTISQVLLLRLVGSLICILATVQAYQLIG